MVVLTKGGECSLPLLEGLNIYCGCRRCLRARGWYVVWEPWRLVSRGGLKRRFDVTGFTPKEIARGTPPEGEEEATRRHLWIEEAVGLSSVVAEVAGPRA